MPYLKRSIRISLLLCGSLLYFGCSSNNSSEPAPSQGATANKNVAKTPPSSPASPENPKINPSPPANSASNNLVGKWKITLPGPNGQSATLSMVFNADGTQEQTVEGNGKVGHIKATYTVKDNTFTQTFVSGEADGKSMPPPKDMSATFTYHIEGDQMALSKGAGSTPVTLTRTKD